MSNRRLWQSGFGVIGILAIVVVLAGIGGIGFFIMNRHKTPTSAVVTAPPSPVTAVIPAPTTTPPPAQAAQHYLVIKEWGVKLTLDSTTASMYYYIDPQLPNGAYLSLKTISAIAPNCAADKYSLGVISRITPTAHQAALSDPTKGIPGSVQIGDYWYGFESPQGGCIDSGQGAAVQHALPGYNPGVIAKAFDTLAAN